MGKRCCHFFFAVFYRILFKLAGNDDIHKSFDEFEILGIPSEWQTSLDPNPNCFPKFSAEDTARQRVKECVGLYNCMGLQKQQSEQI